MVKMPQWHLACPCGRRRALLHSPHQPHHDPSVVRQDHGPHPTVSPLPTVPRVRPHRAVPRDAIIEPGARSPLVVRALAVAAGPQHKLLRGHKSSTTSNEIIITGLFPSVACVGW